MGKYDLELLTLMPRPLKYLMALPLAVALALVYLPDSVYDSGFVRSVVEQSGGISYVRAFAVRGYIRPAFMMAVISWTTISCGALLFAYNLVRIDEITKRWTRIKKKLKNYALVFLGCAMFLFPVLSPETFFFDEHPSRSGKGKVFHAALQYWSGNEHNVFLDALCAIGVTIMYFYFQVLIMVSVLLFIAAPIWYLICKCKLVMTGQANESYAAEVEPEQTDTNKNKIIAVLEKTGDVIGNISYLLLLIALITFIIFIITTR